MGEVYRKGTASDGSPLIELRLGDYRNVLADVECDAVITDVPYSAKTQTGALSCTGEAGVTGYLAWGDTEADALIEWAVECCDGWIVVHTDDVLGPSLLDYMGVVHGRYAFPLVPVLQHQPRLTGDGHPSCGHYLAVSRPKRREYLSWGSLPGWYMSGRATTAIVRGAKPMPLMRTVIRDHSRPGDLVCDPCAGGGTTLIAAALEGRRAIGAELDPETYAKACARIERHALTPPLPGLEARRMTQEDLL